jgi:acyl-CoA synthetase (NDP forming)
VSGGAKHNLKRMMSPRSVAIVGASQPRSDNMVLPLIDVGIDLYLVNPRHERMYDRPSYASLRDVPQAVDAVLSQVNAQLTPDVVRAAAEIGAGGVVIGAAGFAEESEAGRLLQEEIRDTAIAAGLAVCGPNCLGIINFVSGTRLSGVPRAPVGRGGTAVVSHSGGLIRTLMSGARERRLGLSYLVSAGNEAVNDLVDYIDFLIDDPDTRRICLVVEGIRRPQQFMSVAERARQVGKPIIALKTGHGKRGEAIAKSHTAAVLDEAWVYGAAFRRAGILNASNIDDLLDQAKLFDTLPPERWSAAEGIAVLTVSGGTAGLTSDLFEAAGFTLPPVEHARAAISEHITTPTVLNPLDISGFVYGRPDVFQQIIDQYLAAREIDTIVFPWALAEHEEAFAAPPLAAFRAVARTTGKALIVSSIETCRLGEWTDALPDVGLGLVRGMDAAVRSVTAMRSLVRDRAQQGVRPSASFARARPDDDVLTPLGGGGASLMAFDAACELATSLGIPCARHILLKPDAMVSESVPHEFGDVLVVKLADVIHRARLGVVKVAVPRNHLQLTVDELRRRAAELGSPADIVVQPFIPASTELFVGGRTHTQFGPALVCGIGGTFVETLGKLAARLAPLSTDDALALIEELGLAERLTQQDTSLLADITQKVGTLLTSSQPWLDSFELNPILVSPDGLWATDIRCLVRPAPVYERSGAE